MSNKIEIGINEEFKLKFKCVEDTDDKSCNECVFNNTIICNKLICMEFQRKDNTSVHFELINE